MPEQPPNAPRFAPLFAMLLVVGLGIAAANPSHAASKLSEAIEQAAVQNGAPAPSQSEQTNDNGQVVRDRGDRAQTNPDKPRHQNSSHSGSTATPTALHVDSTWGGGGSPAYCGSGGIRAVSIDVVSRPPYYRGEDRGPRTRPNFFGGVELEGLAPEENGPLDYGTRFSFHFGGFEPGPDQRVGFETEAAMAHYDPSRDYEYGIDDVYEFTLGLAMRLYGTSAKDPFGLYGTAGIRGGFLRWDYTSTLLVASGSHVRDIDSDHVSTWSPYFGGGVTFFRGRPLQLDVSLVQAIQFYGDETHVGFENDVFETTTVTQLRIGLIGLF
ncbi:MAG: hypothetical protein H6682_21850 [Candidatus Eisenbacteria bacterium]|nr:hypothetical protein [Candidatus Eisenbacteria bacterium]